MKCIYYLRRPVKLILWLAFIVANPYVYAQKKVITIQKGDVITQSVKVKKGVYYFGNNDSLTPVLTVDGNDITIDFDGAVLQGSMNIKEPNTFSGVGIRIKKGSNVIIKNAIIKGFKVGILAKGVEGLQITGCDLSYNYRQRLKSDRLKENLSDWMSYHHNDKDEWLRFGAGIYIEDCKKAIINNNRVTNGQCALMMTRSDHGRIYNNIFSFNSAVGIGMYKSNRNVILHNKVDWNVRGYSYGYYYRGQDSGGILVFDNCSDNVYANNSVTHSGDGFFLWAGQETIDNGTGGCNDNLLYGNDFSYAPTNAVEITFSRNKVIKNKMHGSWHGIWGGFSYNTIIVKNDFGGNLAGISIEHGQDNRIEQNTFTADSLGIELWAIPNRRIDFGLMEKKDTRSRDYSIVNNHFDKVPVIYSIKNTESVVMANNQYQNFRTKLIEDPLVKDLRYESKAALYDYTPDSLLVKSLLPGIAMQDVAIDPAISQGKKAIMMNEWGPYNFGYPLLWWTETDPSGIMHFEIKGPKGKWKIKNSKGVTILSESSGTVPSVLTVQKTGGTNQGVGIELEYTGKKFISPFGEVIAKGKKYSFGYKDNSLPMNWEVSWFAFDSTNDPIKKPIAFDKLLKSYNPVKTDNVVSTEYRHLNGKGMPASRFATLVNTKVNAPKGTYRLGVTAGDLVRVYIDGKLVIDSWSRSAIRFDADYYKEAIVNLDGSHDIKIIQAQYGGYGMLSCTIKEVE
jgi:parallel beta-helix repeat protein